MTLLVRDEADIVRENILFHLNRGVDHIVVTDNLSKDGTVELVEEFVRQGVADLFFESGDDYAQGEWVTRMALFARDARGADWVLPNDADEFWHPISGNLKDELSVELDAVVAQRRNMLPDPSKPTTAHPLARNTLAVVRPRSGHFTEPDLSAAIGPKVLCKTRSLLSIEQGNHSAIFSAQPHHLSDSSNITVYHYPIRSYEQFYRKVQNGGNAYANNMTLPKEMGWHWRYWHRILQQGGDLRAEYVRLTSINNDLDALRAMRVVAADYTLYENYANGFRQCIDFRDDNLYAADFYDMHHPWENEYAQIARALKSRIEFRSAIDFGCGNAFFLRELAQSGATIKGYDSSVHALFSARQAIGEVVEFVDLRMPTFLGSAELVICTEVVEHLEPVYEAVLLDNIVRHTSKWLFFTGATPEQTGGLHHVNLKPYEDWVRVIERRGLKFEAELTQSMQSELYPLIKEIVWFPKNLMIFSRP